jgi:hypothetical protein
MGYSITPLHDNKMLFFDLSSLKKEKEDAGLSRNGSPVLLSREHLLE